LGKDGSPTVLPQEVIRATDQEKEDQLATLRALHSAGADRTGDMLSRLQQIAITNGNTFEALMETVKYCSLGQITRALYEVGGQYRRNM